jgi:hypothetical protein
MTAGADTDQGIPKAMGGPGFLPSGFFPSFPPSMINVRIRNTLSVSKMYSHFTRMIFSVNKILVKNPPR